VLARAVDENRGPHLTSALLIHRASVYGCTDFDPAACRPPSHFLPSAASHRPHLRVGPGLKSFPARHRTSALLSSSPERPATGNLMEEGMGVPARGGRRESWPHLTSALLIPPSERLRL